MNPTFIIVSLFIGMLIIILGIPFLLNVYVPALIGTGVGFSYELYLFAVLRNEKNSKKFKSKRYQSSCIILCIIFLPIIFTSIITIYYLKEGYIHYFFFVFLSEVTTFLYIAVLFPIPLAIKDRVIEKAYVNNDFSPQLVTIIIPAYNEELNIKWTIQSVIQTTYPNKQIIVVDDGSKDRTYEEARKALRDFDSKRYLILRKENGGKSSALNHGLLYAKGEIVVTIDSDSIVHRNALENLVKIIQDPNISAVAGNPKVLNRTNIITKCQQLEYTLGNVLKGLSSFLGAVTVVPGVLGAFKTNKIAERGKYDHDTIAEDFDLTLKLLKIGGQIKASNDSFVYTQSPTTLKGLYNQRLRWDRGTLQSIIKHKDILKTSRHRTIDNFVYPIFVMCFFAAPILDIITWSYLIAAISLISWIYLVFILVGFFVLCTLLALISILLDSEDKKLCLYAPFMVLGYRQILHFIRIKSWFDVFFSKGSLKWTHVDRTKHRN
jgi:cellulose synthase/poly-beta-1,6-N-acetylglucosamine synthase-like glycosyltransferase